MTNLDAEQALKDRTMQLFADLGWATAYQDRGEVRRIRKTTGPPRQSTKSGPVS